MQNLTSSLRNLKSKVTLRYMSATRSLKYCLRRLTLMKKFLTLSIKSLFKPDGFEPSDIERTHYVVFAGSVEHQMSIFCKKGYKHMFFAEKLEHIWIVMNPTRYGLETFILDANDDFIGKLFDSDKDITKILRIVSRETSKNLMWPPQALTCARITGYLTGIKFGMWRQTPHAIYKYLTTRAHEEQNIIDVTEIKKGD